MSFGLVDRVNGICCRADSVLIHRVPGLRWTLESVLPSSLVSRVDANLASYGYQGIRRVPVGWPVWGVSSWSHDLNSWNAWPVWSGVRWW